MTGVRHKSSLTDPRLVVTKTRDPCRVRKGYVVEGITGRTRSLRINDASIDTLSAALLERMYMCKVEGEFVEPPKPDRAVVRRTLHMFRSKLLRLTKSAARISPEQFAQMYTGRKRTIYEGALSEYYSTGVQGKHAVARSFVKCEKVDPGKAPRCIQPRSPVYNVGLGTYLKHNEHKLYKGIQKVFGDELPVVMKGLNVKAVAAIIKEKWDSIGDCVFIGLDASKFDMHVSMSMLEWEHSIYVALHHGDPELRRLLRMQLRNKGVGFCDDGKLVYKVDGRRLSGDMNTGLGNCIIMCGMVWEYLREKKIEARFINNGDDCGVFLSRRDVETFMDGLDGWFLRMGFRMTVEAPVHELEKVEFCQMRPVNTGQGWVMVRNFESAREKDSFALLPLDCEGAFRKWIYAVGECGLALTSGVPVFQEMYTMFMANGRPSNISKHPVMASGARIMAQGMVAKTAIITPEARASFFTAFGVTPDQQVALEALYREQVLSYGVRAVDNLDELQLLPL